MTRVCGSDPSADGLFFIDRERPEGTDVNCYQHPSIPANGVCKVCGKALCRDCMRTGRFGCTCAGACEMGIPGNAGRAGLPVIAKNLLTWVLVLIVLMVIFQSFSHTATH